jgi:uncharacterized short protein YbdD (DUF466 family)
MLQQAGTAYRRDRVAGWVDAAVINHAWLNPMDRQAKAGKRILQALSALREWWRGASGSYAYPSYLQHANKHCGKPLTAEEFYLDNIQRKYSRPNRCC